MVKITYQNQAHRAITPIEIIMQPRITNALANPSLVTNECQLVTTEDTGDGWDVKQPRITNSLASASLVTNHLCSEDYKFMKG